jgi:arylformamidase
MPPRILDISPLVSARLAVYPGDVPYRREVSHSLARGEALDLSAVHTTLHLGAHADAPSHVVRGGASIDARPLTFYYGPCQVLEVHVGRGERVGPQHLDAEIEAPRVLLKTGTAPDPECFSDDYAGLAPGLVDFLAAQRVRLVGIDTPSVDLFDDADLESHHALARHDMASLEGLVLAHVPAGLYTLVALPLRLEGADASPVRAVLLTSGDDDFPA